MSSKSVLVQTDILVIGAGVMGASIAHQLRIQTDKRITVMDQSAPLGGMSGRRSARSGCTTPTRFS